MTDAELKDIVVRHEEKFNSLTDSLKELSTSMKQLTAGLERIVILDERLINIDKDLKESFKRVHTRQDELEEKFDKLSEETEVVRILTKNPYIILAIIVGLFALNSEPFKKIIGG